MKNMTAMNAKRKQAGFTIIELVVVILLLGILTATALPRFMDVTDEAHQAVVDATAAGLRTGAALYRAQWVAEGQPTTVVDSTGFNLFAETTGYPKSVTATLATTDCLAIYNSLLQNGRPLAASASIQATPGTTLVTEIAANASGNEFVAQLDANATLANSLSCSYYYVGQYQTPAAAGGTRPIQKLTYTFATGIVSQTTFAYVSAT